MNFSSLIVDILEKKEPVDGWTVISLGCGMGFAEVSPKWKHLTGVDIFDYRGASVDKFIQHDIRKIKKIVSGKSFDLVLCLDIIEHLKRKDGLKLIKDAEAISKKAVVF